MCNHANHYAAISLCTWQTWKIKLKCDLGENQTVIHLYKDCSSWSYMSFFTGSFTWTPTRTGELSAVRQTRFRCVCVILLIWEVCIANIYFFIYYCFKLQTTDHRKSHHQVSNDVIHTHKHHILTHTQKMLR